MEPNVPLHVGKFLVTIGIVLVVAGLLLMAGAKFSFWGLGRLPGDVAYKTKNVSFYFPIVTCLFVSVGLTLLIWLISLVSHK
jgi:hypothetical protein